MRIKPARIALVLLIFAVAFSGFACSKKPVGGPAGSSGFGPGGAGGPGGPMGLDDARWRELGINSEAEKREFLDRAQAFENQDVYFDYDVKKLVSTRININIRINRNYNETNIFPNKFYKSAFICVHLRFGLPMTPDLLSLARYLASSRTEFALSGMNRYLSNEEKELYEAPPLKPLLRLAL